MPWCCKFGTQEAVFVFLLATFLHKIGRVCRKVFRDLMIAFCANMSFSEVISVSLYVLVLIHRQYIRHLYVGYQVRHVSAITSLSLGILSDTSDESDSHCVQSAGLWYELSVSADKRSLGVPAIGSFFVLFIRQIYIYICIYIYI